MNAPTISVIIGYKTKLLSDGLKRVLNHYEGFSVIADYPIGDYAHSEVPEHTSETLYILELNCPAQRDLGYIQHINGVYPHHKIITLSYLPRHDMIVELLDSGISGCFLKSCGAEDLIMGMRKIAEGKPYFCSEITRNMLTARKKNVSQAEFDLTERERDVLGMLVNSYSNKQIASALSLSENTVKTHRKNIHAKFGVSNLIGLVRYACRTNLIDFGDDGFCLVCPYVH